jgi:hypothetical protein
LKRDKAIKILIAGECEMGVRRITNHGFLKRIGKFPSLKLGRMVWWESPVERDYIHLLEADSIVSFYQEQPLRIHFILDGKEYFYTPDFLVKRQSKIQIVEVKPEAKIHSEENQRRFRAAFKACLQRGYEFIVATDTMIRVQPRLNNIKSFWKYSRTPLDLHLCRQHCQEFFSQRNEIAFEELLQLFTSKGVSMRVVYALLYRGVLRIDLMMAINSNSVVSFPNTTSNAEKESLNVGI